jgi:hypothetical protein
MINRTHIVKRHLNTGNRLRCLFICHVIALSLISCGDECPDNLDVTNCGVLFRPAMKKGIVVEENLSIDMKLQLKSGEMGIWSMLMGSVSTDFSVNTTRLLECTDWEEDYPSGFELTIIEDNDDFSSTFNFFDSSLKNQTVSIIRRDFAEWEAVKKGSRIATSEEQEDLQWISAEFEMNDEIWPEERLKIGDKWESGIVTFKGLPRYTDVNSRSELQFVSTKTIDGNLCAVLSVHTLMEGELEPDDENHKGNDKVKIQAEGELVYDLVQNIVIAENGRGIVTLEFNREKKEDDTFSLNGFRLEGPFTYNYTGRDKSKSRLKHGSGREI